MFFVVNSALFSGFLYPKVQCRVVMNELWAECLGSQWGREGGEPPLPKKAGGEAVPTPSSASGDEVPLRDLAAAGRLAGVPIHGPHKSHWVLSPQTLTVLLHLAVSVILFGIMCCDRLMMPSVTTTGTFCHWSGFRKEAIAVSFLTPFPSSWIRDIALVSKAMKEESAFLKAWPRFC